MTQSFKEFLSEGDTLSEAVKFDDSTTSKKELLKEISKVKAIINKATSSDKNKDVLIDITDTFNSITKNSPDRSVKFVYTKIKRFDDEFDSGRLNTTLSTGILSLEKLVLSDTLSFHQLNNIHTQLFELIK